MKFTYVLEVPIGKMDHLSLENIEERLKQKIMYLIYTMDFFFSKRII